MLEWLLGLTKGRWMGFLTRDVMLQATRWIICSFQKKFCTNHFVCHGKPDGENI